MATSVDTEIQAIRDMLNSGILINNIERHGFEWGMACASMDMIEDAQLAIDSFGGKHGSDGQRYLEVYGLFQAFFLQQDALMHLALALKLSELKVSKDPDMGPVRELRNKYFGHPSKLGWRDPITYHGLSRITVANDKITGWSYPGFSTESISLEDTIEKQAKGAARMLEQLRQELEAKRKDYIMKFDGKALPTDDHNYEFEKLYLWALQPKSDRAVLASAAHEILSQTLKGIKAGIEERYADPGDDKRTIEKAEFCLHHVRDSIDRGGSGNFEDEIYLDALRKAYGEIVEKCAAINQDFKPD